MTRPAVIRAPPTTRQKESEVSRGHVHMVSEEPVAGPVARRSPEHRRGSSRCLPTPRLARRDSVVLLPVWIGIPIGLRPLLTGIPGYGLQGLSQA